MMQYVPVRCIAWKNIKETASSDDYKHSSLVWVNQQFTRCIPIDVINSAISRTKWVVQRTVPAQFRRSMNEMYDDTTTFTVMKWILSADHYLEEQIDMLIWRKLFSVISLLVGFFFPLFFSFFLQFFLHCFPFRHSGPLDCHSIHFCLRSTHLYNIF